MIHISDTLRFFRDIPSSRQDSWTIKSTWSRTVSSSLPSSSTSFPLDCSSSSTSKSSPLSRTMPWSKAVRTPDLLVGSKFSSLEAVRKLQAQTKLWRWRKIRRSRRTKRTKQRNPGLVINLCQNLPQPWWHSHQFIPFQELCTSHHRPCASQEKETWTRPTHWIQWKTSRKLTV